RPRAAPGPAPADPPVPDSPPTSADSEPLPRPSDRRVPVTRQPVSVTHRPEPTAPVPGAPVPSAPSASQPAISDPPASPVSSRGPTSRTVNTEPCSCDGRMRKIPTYWYPPEY